MTKRKPLSKKQRFEVFKRDLFVCQYCGQKPPAVVLEVDHIVAVANGGSNEAHNLITSCFDCNRGKSAGTLTVTPIDVAERHRLLSERREQARVYEELLSKQREEEDFVIQQVVEIYETHFEGWTLLDRARPSIRRFLKKLPSSVVIDAMDVACARIDRDRAFRYFCGICWRKVRGDE